MTNWKDITRAQISDMILQISVYGKRTEMNRFKRLDLEAKKKVVFVLRKRASRHKKDGENPYDYQIMKEVIEDALDGIFIDLNEGLNDYEYTRKYDRKRTTEHISKPNRAKSN